jgi:hypothetical protein
MKAIKIIISLKTIFVLLKMNKLSFNKTVIFRSNLEGNNTLVRSGSSNDINQNEMNSFICCLLHGTMKKYKNLSESERNESLHKILDEIKSRLPKLEYYKTIINSYIESFLKKIQEFYIYVGKKNSEYIFDFDYTEYQQFLETNGNSLELFQIISEMITINDFQKVFKFSEDKLYKSNNFTSSNFIKILQKEVARMIMYKDFFDDIEKSKQDFLMNSTLNLVSKLNSININSKDDLILIDFIQLDKQKVNFLSQFLDVNIIFIDSETRKPFFIDNNYTFDEKKNSVILLSFDLKYFEIIGKLLNEDKINRSFLSFEEMIKNIVYLIDLNRKKNSSIEIEHKDKEDNENEKTVNINTKDDTKEDTKEEDTKKEDTKKEDTKEEEDTKKEDTKEEDTKKEDTKEEDTKKEDTKEEDTNKENTKKESKDSNNENMDDNTIIDDTERKIHYVSDDELLHDLEEDTCSF